MTRQLIVSYRDVSRSSIASDTATALLALYRDISRVFELMAINEKVIIKYYLTATSDQ